MKKLFLLLIMMMATSSIMAQSKYVDLNRTFNMTGKCVLFSKSLDPTEKDKCNYTWELANKSYDGDNFVTLKIFDESGSMKEYFSWDSVRVFMLVTADNQRMININDDVFSHLRILQVDNNNNWAVSLSSELME